MRKENHFINIELKMLMENQKTSIRFYAIFAAALLTIGSGLIVMFLSFHREAKSPAETNAILNIIVPACGTLITLLSAIPIKEIVAKREKLTAYKIVKHHLEEFDADEGNMNENELIKMRELVWKVIEHTTLA
jgi:heme/copper-type cytochrome/quinol oxidase subunit 2